MFGWIGDGMVSVCGRKQNGCHAQHEVTECEKKSLFMVFFNEILISFIISHLSAGRAWRGCSKLKNFKKKWLSHFVNVPM